MIHFDNKGAIFPLHVAELQVAIVPVGLIARMSEADKKKILEGKMNMGRILYEAGIRA